MPQSIFNPDANPESTTVDGYVQRAGVTEAWATIRAGAGNGAGPSTTQASCVTIQDNGSVWNNLGRGMFLFDLTNPVSGVAIPAAATITAVTFSFYCNSKKDSHTDLNIALVSASPTSNTNLATGDYAVANFGSTRYASDLDVASVTTTAFNGMAFNAAGIAAATSAIGGILKLGTMYSKDLDNTEPTKVSNDSYVVIDFADATNKPKLTIDYSLGNALFFSQL